MLNQSPLRLDQRGGSGGGWGCRRRSRYGWSRTSEEEGQESGIEIGHEPTGRRVTPSLLYAEVWRTPLDARDPRVSRGRVVTARQRLLVASTLLACGRVLQFCPGHAGVLGISNFSKPSRFWGAAYSSHGEAFRMTCDDSESRGDFTDPGLRRTPTDPYTVG